MTDRLHELEATIKALDERLRPFVKLLVNRNQPGWRERSRARLRDGRAAVDRAGIRPEAECALAAAIGHYQSGTDAEREAIRGLFRACDSFAWAAPLPHGPLTDTLFRIHLAVFSIRDLGKDWRDAILWLDDLCASARTARLPVAEWLIETAGLSSDTVRFEQVRMGRSTRHMLLDYAERYRGPSASP
jgi:hypothetical protein